MGNSKERVWLSILEYLQKNKLKKDIVYQNRKKDLQTIVNIMIL